MTSMTSSSPHTHPHCALENWRDWPVDLTKKPTIEKAIASGQTNRSYLLNSHDGRFILRINTVHSHLFGIDRENEKTTLKALAELNIAPHFVYAGDAHRFTVFRYIEGRPWTLRDLRCGQNQVRLQQTINDIQNIKVAAHTMDYAARLRAYERELCSHIAIPESFYCFLSAFEKGPDYTPVLCHHDLRPDNIIESNHGLSIIDWEYSGLGHPQFDQCYLKSQLKTREMSNQSERVDLLIQLIFWLNFFWSEVQKPR